MTEETTCFLYTPKAGEYTFYQPPKPVGYWCLYKTQGFSTQFAMYDKPTDEQIKNTEQMFGWIWRDA